MQASVAIKQIVSGGQTGVNRGARSVGYGVGSVIPLRRVGDVGSMAADAQFECDTESLTSEIFDLVGADTHSAHSRYWHLRFTQRGYDIKFESGAPDGKVASVGVRKLP